MYEDMKGKTALITGAGKRSGMGYAIARRMASLGVHIIIADLGKQDEGSAIKTAPAAEMDEITREMAVNYKVRTLAIPLDVTDSGSVEKMAAEVKRHFERIDILCNNAGAVFGAPSAVHTYDEAQWLKTIDLNLNGTFRVSRVLLPLMLGKPGSIVNTASRAGKFPPILNGAYACAKAAVIMLTKVMAKELGGAGIRVNAICPGQIYTDLLEWQLNLESQFFGNTFEERKQAMAGEIPLRRIGTVEDMADLAVFLASDASGFITGQAINLCGGQLMEV
ncbi:MAG TPA: SDR family NAD(P)-dependent oxidoreductase [Syntrophales bacterium]|jgi:NAD(P)-dependent dehydrogenase (short-subunit alcohol dehydrogenase family)